MTGSAEERDRLRAAVAALEAQRAKLGDEVVDAGLRPLVERIAQLQSPVTEERKLVTTLFADLVGFTAMSERLDPEDVRTVVDRYFAAWTATIEGRGGVVEKFIGDAVMAVFGMRQAQEDDPERAILAALDMVASLDVLNDALADEGGPALEMRVGINTGEVVIGAVGDRPHEEWIAVGDPINVASRLQAEAPVNGILIAHSTFRHVRGVFDVREVAPLALKGKKELVRAYVVERAKPRAFRVPTRGVEGVENPMVGREAELERLRDAYLAASEGDPCLVTIVGEAGMGKSRLLDEFATWLDLLPDEIVFIQGRARQGTEHDAFSLIRDTVASRFEILDTDPPGVVGKKLSTGLGVAGPAPATLGLDGDRAALIGYLLGFELGAKSLPSDLEAQAVHELGTAAFLEWAAGLASADPVVVVLDDIHWADDPSLDLAARLVAEPGNRRMLLVCGARPAFNVRRPQWQATEPRHQRIDLRPLGTLQSRRLVTEILAKVPDLPRDLRDTVVSAAEGNPFHVEELVKMLIEDGVIMKSPHAWTVAQDRLPTVRVPETLVGVLQARIDSLTPEEKSVLHRAAVIGRSFWDRAVVALGDDADGGGIEESLNALRVRELVYGREASSIAGAAEYVFKHAVLRDVAYQSVLRRYRRDYHARAATWLASVVEATERAEEFAPLIAAHYEAAEDGGSAAVWYLRAGRAAASRYANAEALAQLDRSADLADDSDVELRFEVVSALQEIHHIIGDRAAETGDLDTLVELADVLDDPRKQIDVELRRARQATDMGRQGDAEAHARRAVEMTRSIGDDEAAAQALLALGTALWGQGSPAEAVPVLTQALDLAGRAGIDSIAADVQHNRGVAQHYLGRYDDAEADYRDSARAWRRVGGRAGLSRVLNSMGILAYDREEYEVARSSLEQALAAKKAMGDRVGENRVLNNLALVALAQHDYDAGWAAYEGTMEIARQIDDLEGEAASFQGLGQIALRTGRVELAAEYFTESRRLFVEEGDRQGESQTTEQLAQVKAAHGETASARAFAEQAVAMASAAGLSYELAASLTMLARLDGGAGNLSEAESNYRRALELHEELGSRGRLVEARAGLAEVVAGQGRDDEARKLVDEVLDHFRSHGADGIEEPVAALLSCHRALGAADEVTAAELLDLAKAYVEKTSARITDPEVRRSFVEEVQAHRRLAGRSAGADLGGFRQDPGR